MTGYQIVLTPQMVNPGTEGSMDEHIVNGVSIQRTVGMLDIFNGTNRKMAVELTDGELFTDTIGTWAADLGVDIILS